MEFLSGKIPIEVLQKIVFKNLGAKREDVILGSSIGEDAAIVQAGNEILALSSDPITGAEKWLGWLAVHVNANDIATRGIKPRWFNSIILLPKNSTVELVEKICTQMDKAARQLNISIIGGHCEVTPSIDQPIVTGCAIGVAENGKYVNCSGAKIGDQIILTKGVGIEGTAILASDRREELSKIFDEKFLKKSESYFENISVVKEAIVAFNIGGISAMHDPTEGGVAGGLHELADAANVGFNIYEEKIFVSEETQKICNYFLINPFHLISSGSLLIIAKKTKTNVILEKLLKDNIQASVIGEVISSTSGRNLITKNGENIELLRPDSDHLWKALEKPIKH
ncbi:AIR synthase family protein [Candidatus Bathyarchaeota archaeon]|nr:AIR synthase family protein [Candidatus Bathyarchaeota archaeon]